jgi:hypothetical protein
MLKLGPIIILRVDEEAFLGHFVYFWKRMPAEMKDAARLNAIHLKYRPGMRPQAPTVTVNTEGVEQ